MRLSLTVLLVVLKASAFAQLAPSALKPVQPAPAPVSPNPAQPPAPTVPASPAPFAPLAAPPSAPVPAPATTPLPPQTIPTTHSISFEVKIGRAGGATDLKQGSSSSGTGSTVVRNTNSMERVKNGQLELEINLRNFAQRPDQVIVEWAFFAESVNDDSRVVSIPSPGKPQKKKEDPLRFLSDGSQEVRFAPGGTAKVSAESARTTMRESRTSEVTTYSRSSTYGSSTGAYSSKSKVGEKIVGWYVRTRADGKILGFKASSPRFEPFAKDEIAASSLPRANEAPEQDPRRFGVPFR